MRNSYLYYFQPNYNPLNSAMKIHPILFCLRILAKLMWTVRHNRSGSWKMDKKFRFSMLKIWEIGMYGIFNPITTLSNSATKIRPIFSILVNLIWTVQANRWDTRKIDRQFRFSRNSFYPIFSVIIPFSAQPKAIHTM